MKFTLFAVSILLSFSLSLAAPVEENKLIARWREEPRRKHICDPRRRREAVPLLRAYNPKITDHFYTTDRREWQQAINQLGYKQEPAQGRVFNREQPGTVPLYRLYSKRLQDHFYTTSRRERSKAVNDLGYRSGGITAYIYPSELCGSVPLYRLYNPQATDHFYTTSKEERDNAAQSGWNSEGIAGYIFPL
ncbi:hypothetical protein Hypma_005113 [Hypsizygus marmoreus]|uniref:DUF5648 domain-containing protein n=1 Tax=Hypsizygus marmoreus TaxID=39966 RepID=A0A369K079_HYPMA|nr:hypothetical protein Hypma_005113 [Hypsizygus marmoreus]